MICSRRILLLAWACFGLAGVPRLSAQAVALTMSLDTNRVTVGSTTTLRVYAQIVPALRPTSDRIFSWYVDLQGVNTAAVQGEFARLDTSASDNDPVLSSRGVSQGPDRIGIFNTFLSRDGAGRDGPVLLFSLPLTGRAAGRTTLRVAAGSGVPHLAADFIVAPAGGGEPAFGGDYSVAALELEVVSESCAVRATLAQVTLPGGQNRVTISFTPCPGFAHVVEFRDALGPGPWQALPGAPHTAGTVTETNSVPRRFYRVRLAPP
jgi:hypothetical protein